MKKLFYPDLGGLPFESAVSIFLKVSRVNFMPPLELSKILGSPMISIGSLCGWQHDGFLDQVAPYMPISASNLPVGPGPAYRMRDVRRELVFCPQCIRFGYHSVFHMIKHHRICMVHNCTLAIACRECTRCFCNGFAPQELNALNYTRCQSCGFQHVDMVTEITMRKRSSIENVLKRNGEQLSRWYYGVNVLAVARQPEALRYYASPGGRDWAGGILEQIIQEPNPDERPRDYKFRQKVVWLANPAFIPARDGFNFTIRGKTVEHTCRDIEEKYLKQHMTCLSNIDSLTNSLVGESRNFNFCPMALAYTLLRMKLANRDWPNVVCVSALQSGFSEFKDLVSGLGKTTEIREATILFLHILGELEFMVRKEQQFRVVCRYNGRLSPKSIWPLYTRKASYSFRCRCTDLAQRSVRICGTGENGLLVFAGIHSENPLAVLTQAVMVV